MIKDSFKTRKDIEGNLKTFWNLPTNEKGEFDLKFLIGKEIIKRGEIRRCLDIIYIDSYPKIVVEDKNWGLTGVKVFLFNPIENKEEWVNIEHLKKKLFYINQKTFKSLYYKTEEYRNKVRSSNELIHGADYKKKWQEKVQKTLKEKYGTHSFLCRGDHYKKIETIMKDKYGVVIPIQNQEIKNKISKTIEERYEKKWFLCRGDHYKKIETIMKDKYGVVNVFYSEELQKNYKAKRLNSDKWVSFVSKKKELYEKRVEERLKLGGTGMFTKNGNLKLEYEIIYWLLKEFDFITPCFREIAYEKGTINKQKLVYCNNSYYKLDFYDEELNIVVEIQGDYWHCNPTFFDKDFLIKKSKMTANQVWEKDLKRKREIINKLGCKYIVIWENDFLINREQLKNRIKYEIEN